MHTHKMSDSALSFIILIPHQCLLYYIVCRLIYRVWILFKPEYAYGVDKKKFDFWCSETTLLGENRNKTQSSVVSLYSTPFVGQNVQSEPWMLRTPIQCCQNDTFTPKTWGVAVLF